MERVPERTGWSPRLCETLETYDRGELAVSYKMSRLSLRNNQLKFKTAGKLPIILEEFIEYTPI